MINQNKLRLLLALDLSLMDETLIQYINYVSQVWPIEHIDFLHNIKHTELYSIYEEIANDNIDLNRIIEKDIEETIKLNLKKELPYSIHISSENYTESYISSKAKELKSDLVIIGQKSTLRGTGSMAKKLIRILHKNIMIIPEGDIKQFKNVLIPTDFSNRSAKAFKMALKLNDFNSFNIHSSHIYSIPSVYFPYIDREEAIDKAKKHLNKKYSQFLKKHHIKDNIPFELIYQTEHSVVETIKHQIQKQSIDLCIMSARGGNKLKSLLIGSLTNEFIQEGLGIPLIIIR